MDLRRYASIKIHTANKKIKNKLSLHIDWILNYVHVVYVGVDNAIDDDRFDSLGQYSIRRCSKCEYVYVQKAITSTTHQ